MTDEERSIHDTSIWVEGTQLPVAAMGCGGSGFWGEFAFFATRRASPEPGHGCRAARDTARGTAPHRRAAAAAGGTSFAAQWDR